MRTTSDLSSYRSTIFILAVSYALCTSPARAESEVDACYLKAASLSKKGHQSQAIPYFDRAIQIAPNNPRLHDERGQALLELEQRDRALADFNAAIKLDPKNPYRYRHKARCCFELSDLHSAIADISTGISVANDNFDKSELLADRSTFYLNDHQSDKAIADLTTAITLMPTSWPLRRKRGELYSALHQYQKAVDDYNAAFKLAKPDRAARLYGLHAERGRAYEQLGRKDLAAPDFEKANEGFGDK
jgi:tetratricopeptide (TPR) repeat protein